MKPEIESEIAKGKFVVVEEYPRFCNFTAPVSSVIKDYQLETGKDFGCIHF